MYQRALVVVRC